MCGQQRHRAVERIAFGILLRSEIEAGEFRAAGALLPNGVYVFPKARKLVIDEKCFSVVTNWIHQRKRESDVCRLSNFGFVRDI